ncbi:MAG TPA: flagellar hook protein FlgE [Methylomusa anaerophila]|uniref:Flagellar hook protein FlgE n=1 Tax=Methylomusa anaerophila TaxID=1930071 RepID=A0A348AQ31_9FIRM|nr:flagellar hook protein FlgE [Methylomusa anaerophila]BBB93179.1 flagellar hook protein FlgE [Methylomusa anaerophila]HML86989.1 flagellar hook protein FlgE [Methylomusa anaerophila]
MMRSLFSGVAGLKNHQTRMDVIGNNIANVNTVGFKASRVTFQDVLSQTMQGASAPQGDRGGSNPMQVGLGVGVASIDTLFTESSFQPTGKQEDLAIQGNGLFILADGNNQYYTRAGNFDYDTLGNYTMQGNGLKVQGWMADANGVIDTSTPLTGITIPVGQAMPAKATSDPVPASFPKGGVTFQGNLAADVETTAVDPNASLTNTTITVYDAQGNAHKIGGTFAKTGANTWTWTPNATADTGATVAGASTIVFDAATGRCFDTTTSTYEGATVIGAITVTPVAPIGAPAFTFNPDFSALTQFGGESTANSVTQTGYAAGSLLNKTISTDGVITGRFSNGMSMDLAQIAMATFNNPGGLVKEADTLFSKSNNSGEPRIGIANTGGRGSFRPESLEMSNVNLAEEFSNMIITQRGFQANSRIITTTDEMLQDLTNLKR